MSFSPLCLEKDCKTWEPHIARRHDCIVWRERGSSIQLDENSYCIFLHGHYLPVIGVLRNHWSLNKLQAMMIFSFAWHNCAWCESFMTIWCCYRSWYFQQLSSNKLKQYWWLCLWAPRVLTQFVGYMLICPFYIMCKVVNIFFFCFLVCFLFV